MVARETYSAPIRCLWHARRESRLDLEKHNDFERRSSLQVHSDYFLWWTESAFTLSSPLETSTWLVASFEHFIEKGTCKNITPGIFYLLLVVCCGKWIRDSRLACQRHRIGEALCLHYVFLKYRCDVKTVRHAGRIAIDVSWCIDTVLQLPMEFSRKREIIKGRTRSQFEALNVLYGFH